MGTHQYKLAKCANSWPNFDEGVYYCSKPGVK